MGPKESVIFTELAPIFVPPPTPAQDWESLDGITSGVPLNGRGYDFFPRRRASPATYLQVEKRRCRLLVIGEWFLPPHNAVVCIFADVSPQKHAGMNHY